jgi:hypothetical protein
LAWVAGDLSGSAGSKTRVDFWEYSRFLTVSV